VQFNLESAPEYGMSESSEAEDTTTHTEVFPFRNVDNIREMDVEK